jgi:uncharacterized protein (TIGR00730 family)
MHTITVFGSAQPTPGSAPYEEARALGRLLAEEGWTVINGGYSGTMQGVSQGAVEGGGMAVGVTCAIFDARRSGGNPYLTCAVHAPDLLSRLSTLVERGDGYVVLDGGVGTLLELFLVWNLLAIGVFDRPCVLVGPHWRRVLADLARETRLGPRHVRMLNVVDSVGEAVDLLRHLLP